MSKSSKDPSLDSDQRTEKATDESAGWFDVMMSRRQFGVAAAAATVAAAGAGTLLATGCTTSRSENENYQEQESLTLQQNEGWNFGASERALTLRGVSETDVAQSQRWREYNSRESLRAVFGATAAAHLLQSMSLVDALDNQSAGVALSTQMQPIFRPSMEESYQKGVALADIVARLEEPSKTLVILDLPGPESVAAATGMASLVDPVLHFDNWPHPHGVVPSHETLGALLYYAPELDDAKAVRGENAPTVLVLDRQRLPEGPIDEKNGFDNRYGVMLPSLDELQAAGFNDVLYVVPTENDEELDDLNEFFAALSKRDGEVKRLSMDAFQLVDEEQMNEAQAFAAAGVVAAAGSAEAGAGEADAAEIVGSGEAGEALKTDAEQKQTKEPEYHEHRSYYYGGSPFGSYFLMAYLLGPRMGYVPTRVPPASRVSPPRKRTVASRPTAFSQRYAGANLSRGAAVGRARPTGIGRVTVPVDGAGRPTGAYVGSAAAAGMAARRNAGSGAAQRSGGAQSRPPRRAGSAGRGVFTTGG